MTQSYQEELARGRGEAETYVQEHYTEGEIAREASGVGWEPEDYREWLVKVHGGLLIPSRARGQMKRWNRRGAEK